MSHERQDLPGVRHVKEQFIVQDNYGDTVAVVRSIRGKVAIAGVILDPADRRALAAFLLEGFEP